MKKNLLFVAMLLSVASTNAQIKWTMESTDGTVAKAVVTSDGITASEAALGKGLEIIGVDKSHKNKAGNSENWVVDNNADGAIGIVKLQPTNIPITVDDKATTEDQYRKANTAVNDNGMYVNYKIETAGEDLLDIESVEFDATRVGTDAVRVNARFIYEGDESGTSAWMITPTNATSVSDAIDGVGGHWYVNKGTDDDITKYSGADWADVVDAGYVPDRNDASKTNNSTKCSTHFKIPVSSEIIPAGTYLATLQIAVYGFSNTKQALLHNVIINGGVKGKYVSAISSVTASETTTSNAALYNLAGQKVNKDYKGVVVCNGKKYIK
nr:hypothetical protein [Prevotella sp.]